jgi:negative elongation factor E
MTKPKQEPEKNILKRPAEAKDAKEVAKKLIKTGAIRAIKSSIEKEKIKEEKINSGFKRSQVHICNK